MNDKIILVISEPHLSPGVKCPLCGTYGRASMTGPFGIAIIFCPCVGAGMWGVSGESHGS
jgi:hypothetical protein